MFNLENQNKEQDRTNAKTPEHPSFQKLKNKGNAKQKHSVF